MKTLFGQVVDKHKDLAYDFSTDNRLLSQPRKIAKKNSQLQFSLFSLEPDIQKGILFTNFHAKLIEIFQRHGAVEIFSPLLIPSGSTSSYLEKTKCVELLDSSGLVVQLPYDHTIPFARYVARMKNVSKLKRWTLDRIFRPNLVGGQPHSFLECEFDIVTSTSCSFLPDAECIKTALEIIESAGIQSQDLIIQINHSFILEFCLKCNFYNMDFVKPNYNFLQKACT
jgi:eukaryotic translation initiation factor 2-alpha kinase 4